MFFQLTRFGLWKGSSAWYKISNPLSHWERVRVRA